MPIYEFQCENCRYKEDKILSVSNRNNSQECPKCHKNMTRLIGTPGLAFKGTGFYTTDVLHKKTLRKQVLKDKKRRQEGKSTFQEY